MAVKLEKKMIGDHVAVIAVDIDGVIALHENLPMSKRYSYHAMKRVLDKFVMRGYNVILYTSRDISRKMETEEWLIDNDFFKCGHDVKGGHYHDIVYNKLKYDCIIDNKAINISDPDIDLNCDLDSISELIECVLG